VHIWSQDTPRKEAKMSIIGGLVDAHHEMELSPSVHLVRRTWFARHLLAILALVVATIALAFAL